MTDKDLPRGYRLADFSPAFQARLEAALKPESPQTPPAAPAAPPIPLEAVAVRPAAETPPQPVLEGPFHATLGPRQRRPRTNPLRSALDWLAPPVDAPATPAPHRFIPWAAAATIALGAVLAGGLLMAHPGTVAAPSGYACMVEGVTVQAAGQAACEAAQAKAAAQVQPTTAVPTVAAVPPSTSTTTSASTNPPVVTAQPAPTTAPKPQPVATQPPATPSAKPVASSAGPGPAYTVGHGLTIVGGTAAPQPSAGVRAAECWILRLPKGAGNGC